MIGLFKQKNPANIFFVFLLAVLIKLPLFQHPVHPTGDAEANILYKVILSGLNNLAGSNTIFFSFLTFLLLLIQSLQLNKLMNDFRMMQRSTFLPAVSYLMITSLLPEWNVFSAPLLVNSLVLWIFPRLFRLYNLPQAKATIFNIGLATGICSFLFFPSLLLVGWLLLALMVMRTSKLTEWLVCLMGVTTPFYFYTAWLIFTDQWSWKKLILNLHPALQAPEQSLWLAAGSLLLIVPFLTGGYFVQENLRKMLIQVRKNWSLLLIYLVFALLIPFFINPSGGLENWIFIAVPFAAFHACTYLYPPQRWFPSVIFWVSLLYILAYQYMDYLS